MTKAKLNKVIAYVNASMDRAGKANNIGISFPTFSEKDLEYLRQHFKTVRPMGFMGYVTFEREAVAQASPKK